jgi:photosystem II stability/assembly factor-like uncharacterized protein
MKSISLILAVFVLSFTTSNSQWQQTAGTPQGAGVTDMVVLSDGTLIVTTANYNWPNGQPGGIRRSTDGGNTWQNVMNNYNARSLYLGSSGKIFASCWNYPQNEGMFFSTNSGVNWVQSFFGASNDNVFSIAAKNGDSMVYVGTRNGVYRSFNNGAWIQLMSGMPVNSWVRDLAIVNNKIFAATTNGLFKSTNQGNSWSAISGLVPGDTTVKLEVGKLTTADNGDDGPLFVGTSNGRLYISDGEPYEVFDITYFILAYEVSGVAAIGDFVIMTLYPRGGGNSINVTSYDGGETWGVLPPLGLPSVYRFSALTVKFNSNNTLIGNYQLYTGMFMNGPNGAGIFTLSSPIGIQNISSEVPGGFSLSQNYPNPFNPSTNIEFAIPKSSFVKLVVYDMLGREVETLMNGELKAGTYKADWNASSNTSGVYFYKLITEGFTETRKMLMIK